MPVSKHRRRSSRSAPGGRTATGARLTSGTRRKKTNYLYLAASAIIAILVIGSFAVGGITGLGRGEVKLGDSDKYVEGVGVQQTIMPGQNHVPEGQAVKYNTTPPTSGDHWGRWADCGFYKEGLPDERVVHNLEHSNILVSYNLLAPEEVKQLKDALDGIGLNKAWGVTRFYDKIPEGTVAVAAWGILDTMQGVDRDRIRKFFEAYAGKIGPEKTDQGIGIPCY